MQVSDSDAGVNCSMMLIAISLDPVGADSFARNEMLAVFARKFVADFQQRGDPRIDNAVDRSSTLALGLNEATPAKTSQMIRDTCLRGASGLD